MKIKKIPKFRKVTRIMPWIWRNEYLLEPEQLEDLFLSSKEPAEVILDVLCKYANLTNLSPKLKDLVYVLSKEVIPDSPESLRIVLDVFHYLDFLDKEKQLEYLNLFKGKSYHLVDWARRNGRLPKNLEDSLDNPPDLVDYAVWVLKGRLPEHLEEHLHKNVFFAIKYGIEVMRNFSSPRLPESLHNLVIMKSFENPDDDLIKNYVKASENDPSKLNNFSWE